MAAPGRAEDAASRQARAAGESSPATAGRDEPTGDRQSAAARREPESTGEQGARDRIAGVFTRIEDLVYIGLAVLLAASAVVLLVDAAIHFVRHLAAGTLASEVVDLLDRILLILIFVEVSYTVQMSFREHALVPEPFLIVGLIAAIRRILVLTAEIAELLEKGEALFRSAVIELAVLTVLIVALVASLLMLRRRAPGAVAERQ
jgi:phosphate starvation-inducible membrane PsiE